VPDYHVSAFSNSGLQTLRKCAYKWKLRYVERLYEARSPAMLLGSVVGAAECQSDHTWIESGEPLGTAQVLDCYSDEFELAANGEAEPRGEDDVQTDIDWGDDKPGDVKDVGYKALKAYHEVIVPSMARPVDAEREARIQVEHEDGDLVEFVAYLDVETEDGIVIDRKVKKAKLSQADADADKQPTAYLAVRRAEGNPAPKFVYHPMVKTKTPYAQEPLPTERTDAQLDHFLVEILRAADEVAWRLENDNWSYAPDGAWWCGEKYCGYWSQCPAGGLLRRRAAQAVAAA
jgi:hypothetical protein